MVNSKARQYCGLVLCRESKEIIPSCPIIWFSEDGVGGWDRLKIKFELHNLLFDGHSVPASTKAANDCIRDLVSRCKNHGVVVEKVPTKAIPFGKLIPKLENLGLLPKNESEPLGQGEEDAALLSVAHKETVKEFINAEERFVLIDDDKLGGKSSSERNNDQEVVASTSEDCLSVVVQNTIGDISLDPQNGDLVIPPRPETLDPAAPPPEQPIPADQGNPSDQDLQVLRKEVQQRTLTIKQLEQELSQSRAQCLQLENSLNTDRSHHATAIEQAVCRMLDEKLELWKPQLTLSVSQEIKLELTRHVDRIVDEVTKIKQWKTQIDGVSEKTKNIFDCYSDIAKGVGSLKLFIKTSYTDKMESKIGGYADSLSQMSSKLSANTAILAVMAKKLEVEIGGNSLPGTPLTPGPTPPKKARRQCRECGSFDHIADQCPTKLDFCARCMSRQHRTFECPTVGDKCDICWRANRGEISYGHTKKVHSESDPAKRNRIVQFVNPNCFPEWERA